MFTLLGCKLGERLDDKEYKYWLQNPTTHEYLSGRWFLWGGFGFLVDLGILVVGIQYIRFFVL